MLLLNYLVASHITTDYIYARQFNKQRRQEQNKSTWDLSSQQHSTLLLQNMQISFTFTAIKSKLINSIESVIFIQNSQIFGSLILLQIFSFTAPWAIFVS